MFEQNLVKVWVDGFKINRFTKYSILFTSEHGRVHRVVTFERASELVVAMGLCDIEDSSELGVSRFHERMVAIRIAFVSSLLIVDDEERISSTLRQSLSLVGFMEFLSRLALVEKLDLRLQKERVVIKGKRHGNIVAANFYNLGFPDKLDRFLTVYVLPLSLKADTNVDEGHKRFN